MKFLFRILFSIASICLFITTMLAQDAPEPLHLRQANKSFYNKAYTDAIPQFLYSIKKDSSFHQAMINLADCYRLTNDPIKAEVWYKKVVTLKEAEPIHQLYLGEALMENRKYDEAKKWLELYSKNAIDDSRGYDHLQTIKQLNKYFKDSSYVKVKKISINSNESDFSPVPYKGGLIFTSARKKMSLVERTQAWTGKNFFSIFYADGKDSISFYKPKMFAPEIQTNYNNGPLCISKDFKTIYFTRNNPNGNSSDKIIKLEIYESHIKADEKHWDEQLIPFRWNSNTYNCAHPAISADGTKLFFTSDMKSGYGGMDLYVCKRDGNTWGEPENLGSKINTPGNEVFPFMDDNGTLYFASDGHDGLGGLDIFTSTPTEGVYTTPENMGAPMNSNSDDFGISITGKRGYFSSNRAHKGIDDDIYQFVNTKPNKLRFLVKLVDSVTLRPISNTHVDIRDVLTKESLPIVENNGLIYADLIAGFDYIFEADAENYKSKIMVPNISIKSKNIVIPMSRLANAKNSGGAPNICLTGIAYSVVDGKKSALSNVPVVVIDNITKEKVTEGITNVSGKYKICNLPGERTYKVQTSFSNYFGSDLVISTKHILYDSTVYQDFSFEKVVLGKSVKVEKLNFESGQSTITPAVIVELDKIVDKLKDNPKIVVELGIHTDCRGLAQNNLDLSDDRARGLKDYIVSKGIESKRVTYIGYGEAVPINKCECEETVVVPCTEEEHQQNNRVELKVIGFLKNGIIVSE
jgi:outer membrane protein OmpA-like peptidoglycan-associated protein